MSLIGDDPDLWPYAFGMDDTPKWAMPWVKPGALAQRVLAVLPAPLRACATGFTFDAEEFYATCYDEDEPPRRLSPAEKSIRGLGERMEWRIERVWALDDESTSEEIAAYEKGFTTVAGCGINPRCLDDYSVRAWEVLATIGYDDDDPDWELGADAESLEVHSAALEWAQAGVVVLQQSLPWPFVDVLPYSINDNRPAHRVLYAYASLLAMKSMRQAKPWFRAMLYMNPNDNLGISYAV
ncbi:hypothetical protein A5658_03555 [Mycobacterium sp. 1245111.1]|uniref:hypothetical protein n=1 Tax=Mycobacterium sp. 1245111.1 TaxID=1834073 RepID=UPI0007FDF7A3|nr:hypothetical protein [Mycobacterium sp. 1245111.1]OBK38608.1 hypothetical protein A5658_03555 [Mycobacterium sp. 1245111.1]